jgi:hypothetical protein
VLEGGVAGVLVFDFYAAYDSMPCAQQKCLAHLIRDMNDNLFRNQLDADLRDLVQGFSGVLKPIISTIDEQGSRPNRSASCWRCRARKKARCRG